MRTFIIVTFLVIVFMVYAAVFIGTFFEWDVPSPYPKPPAENE